MKHFAEEAGADVLTLKMLCSFDNEAEAANILPQNPDYRRFRYDDKGDPIRIQNPCRKFWNHPTVYRDGIVVPCDYHTSFEHNLGNVFAGGRRPFWRAWTGSGYKRLRSRFLKKDVADVRCSECSLNYADVDQCASHAFWFSRVRKHVLR